jgi:uncharacterized protein (TIGR00369 family)
MSAADAGIDPGPEAAPPAGMPAQQEALRVPAGFQRFRATSGFVGANGPLFVRHEAGQDAAQFRLGFRVEPRHCNPMGICHGGMLATFADMLLPIGAVLQLPALHERFLPTVSLQIDYVGPAKLGAWVEGEMQVLRQTRSMVFAQGLVRADGELALRCSGVFKIGPQIDRQALAAAGRL